MKIQRNLKEYLYNKFRYFEFDRKYHFENNNKYTRKNFLIQVCNTYYFQIYNFQCEMNTLLTVVQQRLCSYVRKLTSHKSG